MQKHLAPKGNIKFVQVKFEEKLIACRIDLIYRDWMYGFGQSSNQNFLHLRGNSLARYHAMCEGMKAGCEMYDLMGGGEYKAQFGAEKVTTHTLIYSRFGLYTLRDLAKRLIKFKNWISFKIARKH